MDKEEKTNKNEQQNQDEEKKDRTKKILVGVGAALALGAVVGIPTGVVLGKQEIEIVLEIGAAIPEVQRVKKGSLVSLLNKPSKEGHTFAGWYSTKDFKEGTKVEDNVILTKNTTLYAKFVANAITFTYYVEDQEHTYSVEIGSTVGEFTHLLETKPNKDGHSFIGWEDASGNRYADDQIITDNMVLYAVFEQNVLTLLSLDGTQYGETLMPNADGIVMLPTNALLTEVEDTDSGELLYFQGWIDENADTTSEELKIYKPCDDFQVKGETRLKAYYSVDPDWYKDYTFSIKDDYCIFTAINSNVINVEIPVLYRGKLVTAMGTESSMGMFGPIKSMILPRSIQYIGGFIFTATNLDSLVIPDSVTNIDSLAFKNSSIKSLIVASGNEKYEDRGANAIIEKSTNTLLFGCLNTIIPDSVTSIGDFAFYEYRNLTSITIPNSVVSISYSAFRGASLQSITIESAEIYKTAETDFYGLLGDFTIRVLKTVDDGSNIYLSDTTKYTKTEDGNYNVYMKIK